MILYGISLKKKEKHTGHLIAFGDHFKIFESKVLTNLLIEFAFFALSSVSVEHWLLY